MPTTKKQETKDEKSAADEELDVTKTEQDAKPKDDPVLKGDTEPVVTEKVDEDEPFDKERAMNTIRKLRAEVKVSSKERDELEALRKERQERADAELSEADRLKKRAEEAEAKAKKLELDVLRRDVAAEVGLPAALAERLKGDTKEELIEDAKTLKAAIPQQKQSVKLNSTNPQNGDGGESEADRRKRLTGQGINFFGDEIVKGEGAGVVWNVPPKQE